MREWNLYASKGIAGPGSESSVLYHLHEDPLHAAGIRRRNESVRSDTPSQRMGCEPEPGRKERLKQGGRQALAASRGRGYPWCGYTWRGRVRRSIAFITKCWIVKIGVSAVKSTRKLLDCKNLYMSNERRRCLVMYAGWAQQNLELALPSRRARCREAVVADARHTDAQPQEYSKTPGERMKNRSLRSRNADIRNVRAGFLAAHSREKPRPNGCERIS